MSFAVAKYRAARTQTASPLQIVVQLYEGCLRFLRVAREAILEKDYSTKGTMLRKAHAIVSELQATLRPDEAPELCEQLYSLYDFVCVRINEANAANDPDALDAAIDVMEVLRSAWVELHAQQGSTPPGPRPVSTPAARPPSSPAGPKVP